MFTDFQTWYQTRLQESIVDDQGEKIPPSRRGFGSGIHRGRANTYRDNFDDDSSTNRIALLSRGHSKSDIKNDKATTDWLRQAEKERKDKKNNLIAKVAVKWGFVNHRHLDNFLRRTIKRLPLAQGLQ